MMMKHSTKKWWRVKHLKDSFYFIPTKKIKEFKVKILVLELHLISLLFQKMVPHETVKAYTFTVYTQKIFFLYVF